MSRTEHSTKQPASPASDRPKAVVLVNARSTRFDGDFGTALDPLRSRYDVEVVRIDNPGRFSKAIAEAGPRADLIVVASGDGTLARSANALAAAPCPIAVLPLGNANDLARGLGWTPDLRATCEGLLEAREVAVDLGLVNGHPFLSAASIGVGVEVSQLMDVESKRSWGRLSHLPRVARAIFDREPFRVRMELDGRTIETKSVQVTVGNGRTIGGGIVLGRDALLDDGEFHVTAVEPLSLPEIFWKAPFYVTGRREELDRVRTLRARDFRLLTSPPMPIATDGEVVTSTPAEFRVVPGAIRFLASSTQGAAEAVAPPRSETRNAALARAGT